MIYVVCAHNLAILSLLGDNIVGAPVLRGVRNEYFLRISSSMLSNFCALNCIFLKQNRVSCVLRTGLENLALLLLA